LAVQKSLKGHISGHTMDPDIPTLDETVKSGKQRLGFSRLRLKNPIKKGKRSPG
jgi:hypothetical protein